MATKIYNNPSNWSDSRLLEELQGIQQAARAALRSYQKARQRGSLYSADFEGLAARNKQMFGTEQFPARLPEDRALRELYYRRAQEMLNLGSTVEMRARIREQAQDLFEGLGQTFDPKRYGFKEQKAVSQFLQSDEWKNVYNFSSAAAFKLLHNEIAGVPQGSINWDRVYAVFRGAYAQIIE